METAVPVVLKNDEITFEQLRTLLYEQREFHNVVISPGPGSPTRAEGIGMNDFYYLPLIRYVT
jgi:para-aminobenzoate synthetase